MKVSKTVIYSILFLIFSISLLSSCKDKEGITEIEETPFIELKSINKTTIKAFEDSIVFEIFYRDGNGDLGENNDGIENLFLIDSRNQITYSYRIPQLAPDLEENKSIAIQGTLNVVLKNTTLLDENLTEEKTIYSIYMIDRAGNKSNTVISEEITIVK
jgi:hypothetical protein